MLASEAAIRASVARPVSRASGLADQLRRPRRHRWRSAAVPDPASCPIRRPSGRAAELVDPPVARGRPDILGSRVLTGPRPTPTSRPTRTRLLGRVADGFDVVAVGIADERAVVVRVVLGPERRLVEDLGARARPRRRRTRRTAARSPCARTRCATHGTLRRSSAAPPRSRAWAGRRTRRPRRSPSPGRRPAEPARCRRRRRWRARRRTGSRGDRAWRHHGRSPRHRHPDPPPGTRSEPNRWSVTGPAGRIGLRARVGGVVGSRAPTDGDRVRPRGGPGRRRSSARDRAPTRARGRGVDEVVGLVPQLGLDRRQHGPHLEQPVTASRPSGSATRSSSTWWRRASNRCQVSTRPSSDATPSRPKVGTNTVTHGLPGATQARAGSSGWRGSEAIMDTSSPARRSGACTPRRPCRRGRSRPAAARCT